ncbi:BAK_1a_G0021480.mRNA.1.CDS.1 [Saccharomyces cerevisiae]|nr:BAK_1a_G0021480.mRNA.1.CDS.1 [Saccharomyces cerevisiae]CAI7130927.1 BAK_1a_G0021480.mRNA.1.CDS.1 [Saccharomyces cerevisiae]
MSRQSAFKFQNGNRHERACLSDVHKILIIILYSTKGKRELGKRITHFMYIHILYISIPSKYSAILFFDVIKRKSIFLVIL